ncbi:hypothetical protein HYALB_00005692 [Hymenoscyphus albidus]|uniref:Uncharacterized protein n=1 Tax=Hymenoscyphus albidus TaxID=595503 RepID=A0A9N9Q5E7_9HELO|nr:hypothetical protein HYALB_00005692 [Hymenoscyphus albidus]
MRESFWGVFWVDVDTSSTARNGFLSIARALEKPAESVEDVCSILANIKQTWLLVLDNADDPKFDYQTYFPSGSYGSLIMTSRIPSCGSQYNNVGWEMLDSLDDKHAVTLLLKAARIREDEWAACQQAATDVTKCLGSHTLAVIQAGAYIAKDHKRLDRYPAIFQAQRKRLLISRPDQANSRYGDVYATLEASAEIWGNPKTKPQKTLFAFSASDYVSNTGIDDVSPWHVSKLPGFISVEDSEWDDYRLVEAVSTLQSFSLVSRNETEGWPAISMHPLAHAWAKDRQESSEQYQAWITTGCILALYLSCASPKSKNERYFRPHLQSFLDIIEVNKAFSLGPTNAVLAIYLKCGWPLKQMRDDYRLEQLLKDIFFEIKLDADKPTREFMPLFKLRIRCLQNLSSFEKAVSLGQKVLKSEEARLKEDDPEILSLQRQLALAHIENNQLRKCYKPPWEDSSQHGLAIAYLNNNQILKAISLLEKVVLIRQNTHTEDHPRRLASEHELASAYLKNNQILEAISLLEKVVRIQQNTLTEEHPERLASEHELASAYLNNNQIVQAISLFENIVQIQKTIIPEDRPDRLQSEDVLAIAYYDNGQLEKALELMAHVVQIRAITLRENDPDRVNSARWLKRMKRKELKKQRRSDSIKH